MMVVLVVMLPITTLGRAAVALAARTVRVPMALPPRALAMGRLAPVAGRVATARVERVELALRVAQVMLVLLALNLTLRMARAAVALAVAGRQAMGTRGTQGARAAPMGVAEVLAAMALLRQATVAAVPRASSSSPMSQPG